LHYAPDVMAAGRPPMAVKLLKRHTAVIHFPTLSPTISSPTPTLLSLHTQHRGHSKQIKRNPSTLSCTPRMKSRYLLLATLLLNPCPDTEYHLGQLLPTVYHFGRTRLTVVRCAKMWGEGRRPSCLKSGGSGCSLAPLLPLHCFLL